MADYLFVPEIVLARWSEEGRILVDGDVLTIVDDGNHFALTSAVRFVKMEAGEDSVGLLRKVRTKDALRQMGAEHYLESVLLGEAAYLVQQGFLADAHALRRAADVSQPPTPRPQHETKSTPFDEKKALDQDMLAKFLLDHL